METAAAKKSKSNKKRKTHTTRAYRKTEQEVQSLLQLQNDAFASEQTQTACEVEELSVNFFHALDDKPNAQILRNEAEASAESEEDSAAEPVTAKATNVETFIQIELTEPVIWPQLYKQRHFYDDSLWYAPSSTPHFQLQLNETHFKSLNIRMLNRFQENNKSDGSKLSSTFIAQLGESPNFLEDKTLYRSDCVREFPSVFIDATPRQTFNYLPQRRCLKLCFKQLRFTEHPYQLDEHRLAQQVEDLYELYTQQIKQQIVKKLQQELQIARNVATQLLSAAPEQQQSERVIKHQLNLVQQLRERYYAEATLQRTVLQQLLAQWAKLKELRQQQQFQCTRLQLSLRVVKPIEIDTAYAVWKEHFETDLAEVYREHLEIYYCKSRLWGEEQQQVTAKKPPRKPQFKKIMHHVKTEYDRAFNDPEEPHVDVLRLNVDDVPLYTSNIPGAEQLNKGRSYFMKLYLDEQFVAQTRSYRLEPDLHLYMDERIVVLLERSLPQQAHIWLYEKSLLTPQSRRIAQITTPLSIDSGNVCIQEKFSFTATSPTAKLAGDLYLNFDFRDNGEQNGCKFADIKKIPDELGKALLPVKLQAPPPAYVDKALAKSPCDKEKKSNISETPLIFAEQQLQFCRIETLLENKRFQLLHSRHQQRNFHTKQLRFVPALDHEIADDNDLMPSTAKVLEQGSYWNPIDLHRHRGRKFLQLLYEAISNQSVQRAKTLQTPHPLLLAHGEEQTGWTALWLAVCSLFGTQRLQREPNTPRSMNWRPQLVQGHNEQFTVSLHVVRATGVPVRSSHILSLEKKLNSGNGTDDMNARLFVTQTLMYSNVRPFVTLSYGQRLCRSSTAEGSNPTWNEQLQLQINGQLSDFREELKINLYDELIEQQYSDETMSHGADIYQRVQCNWLGEYRIPISSLLACRKFEGCIELNIPKVLVGYKRPLIDSITHMSSEQYPEFKESVHLWLYISIEPKYELPPLQINALACAELPELQAYLRQQRLELQQLQPQRYVEPLVCTSKGKRVCLTRFLEPVPLAIPISENTLDSACRYVALLCQMRSYDACQGLQGVWLDNQTLLDCTWGSAKDLGVLLCNFILSLGIQCWLVLGMACPYGECAFVLYKEPETGEQFLIAPGTGKRYGIRDAFCPLTRVYCIVTAQNIFCNIQLEMRVSMTNFNTNDSSLWLPVFTKRHSAPQGGVQKLNYVFKRSFDVNELQKNIERKVMKKITAWRTTRKTIWNRAFQPRLMTILKELEKLATFSSSRYDEPAFSEELEREYPSCRLYGFTLNFAYTNLQAISERIRSTYIHYNNNDYVEFCCAVHIHSYANDVLSVWLFLLSIVPQSI